jgi:hypothetical protein
MADHGWPWLAIRRLLIRSNDSETASRPMVPCRHSYVRTIINRWSHHCRLANANLGSHRNCIGRCSLGARRGLAVCNGFRFRGVLGAAELGFLAIVLSLFIPYAVAPSGGQSQPDYLFATGIFVLSCTRPSCSFWSVA